MVEFHPLSVIMKDYQSFGNSFCFFCFFFFSFNSPILKYKNLIKIRHCLRFPFSIYRWHRNCGVSVFFFTNFLLFSNIIFQFKRFFLQISDNFLTPRPIKNLASLLAIFFSFFFNFSLNSHILKYKNLIKCFLGRNGCLSA